jgi:hypothetical protein
MFIIEAIITIIQYIHIKTTVTITNLKFKKLLKFQSLFRELILLTQAKRYCIEINNKELFDILNKRSLEILPILLDQLRNIKIINERSIKIISFFEPSYFSVIISFISNLIFTIMTMVILHQYWIILPFFINSIFQFENKCKHFFLLNNNIYNNIKILYKII